MRTYRSARKSTTPPWPITSTPFNLALQEGAATAIYDLPTPEGLAAIDQLVNRQAVTLAFLQDFQLMMWITLAALPLILLFRPPERKAI